MSLDPEHQTQLKRAVAGSNNQQLELAVHYLYEEGNIAEGIHWLQRAASGGSEAGGRVMSDLEQWFFSEEIRRLLVEAANSKRGG